MILSGEIVLNAETRSMVKMIRSNELVCKDISDLLSQGLEVAVVARLVKFKVCAAVQTAIAEMPEFTRAAMNTAIHRKVNWQSVVQLSQIYEENN